MFRCCWALPERQHCFLLWAFPSRWSWLYRMMAWIIIIIMIIIQDHHPFLFDSEFSLELPVVSYVTYHPPSPPWFVADITSYFWSNCWWLPAGPTIKNHHAITPWLLVIICDHPLVLTIIILLLLYDYDYDYYYHYYQTYESPTAVGLSGGISFPSSSTHQPFINLFQSSSPTTVRPKRCYRSSGLWVLSAPWWRWMPVRRAQWAGRGVYLHSW